MDKLGDLGLPHFTCMWIYSFLTGHSQRVRVGHHTSTVLSISTGSPQGCVLSPLLYTLFTHRTPPPQEHNHQVCGRHHNGGTYVWGEESAYRDKVERLTVWCRENNLLLNTSKTKELSLGLLAKTQCSHGERRRPSAGPCGVASSDCKVQLWADAADEVKKHFGWDWVVLKILRDFSGIASGKLLCLQDFTAAGFLDLTFSAFSDCSGFFGKCSRRPEEEVLRGLRFVPLFAMDEVLVTVHMYNP
ncbi:hypothetical protein QTP70_011173 [Hemibagrus guttatus]|uniref:Reverse transcriptase domain-containing protein n=1 Tax=Hemibagrus guttatus TaxID=175788 RepID=A0AAE0V0V6_9TELE|nr:hypothetical protein QTP70_011173 [Hemibagrus guttatus]KAK3559410.1 hypothetical protein QTP86_013359 [Hemibagrus guttatus]